MSDAASNPPLPEGQPQSAKPKGGDSGGAGGKPRTFQAPKGTRDFYPQDLLRRRYIIDTWRRVSLRHGFEEIDGPTFEDSQLYTVKSGEGILNELFGAYSGKDPNDTKQVQSGGPPPFALRPEFTPTLARMYAARAKQLPQPTKWFCVSNFFRAERPQRGRLREFWQWNADVISHFGPDGTEDVVRLLEYDTECVALMVSCLADCGLSTNDAHVHCGSRASLEKAIGRVLEMTRGDNGIRSGPEVIATLIDACDRFAKMPEDKWLSLAINAGVSESQATALSRWITGAAKEAQLELSASPTPTQEYWSTLWRCFNDAAILGWARSNGTIARGLAYYTGLVFELIAEGERAVAGGGRYDKLIELFGGPPTPAVGFGMGDVVLTNLLDDRKLMPEGKDLLEATSRPLPVRCDVFVVPRDESTASRVVPLIASLRRGIESEIYRQGECKPWSEQRYAVPPLHARRSYRSSGKISKLLEDADRCESRYTAILEPDGRVTLRSRDTDSEPFSVEEHSVGQELCKRLYIRS